MKTSTKKIVIIQIIIVLLLVLSNLFLKKDFYDYVVFFILLIGAFLNYFLNGYANNKYPDKKKIIVLVIIISLMYQIINYAFWGMINGFVKSVYTINLSFFLKLIIPSLLVITISEVLRHQMLTKGKSSTFIFITTTILFIIVDLSLNIKFYNIKTLKEVMETTMILLLPSIVKNLFLSNLAFNYGYSIPIIYRVILEVLIYFLPYYVDIPIYIETIISLLLPFILLMSINYIVKLYKRNIEKEKVTRYSKIKNLVCLVIVFMSLIFFALISGIFKYTIVAIGSNSMSPSISRGDAVIIKSTKDYGSLKTGNIIIYKKENKLVIHRIKEIKKENDKYYFITKGDANKNVDNWIVKEEEIIGKSLFKIKNIGYPTIWLSNILGG